ncbi:MAG: hypothetical protein A2X67_06185 [Ignavibacteria bacterium GWA2_55_11]|nr:MAG: hypothetical protein A2X67_06185 [Ignavibacteria bacterium GWA2_55_11]
MIPIPWSSGTPEAYLVGLSISKLKDDYLPRYERCLSELSDKDVWWREHETNNAVGNIILHICGNMRQWVISGVSGAADIRNRPEEFSARKSRSTAELKDLLRSTITEVCAHLERADPADFKRVRSIQSYSVTGLEALYHAVEHCSYHLGQVVYVTKLRTGKDLRFYNL